MWNNRQDAGFPDPFAEVVQAYRDAVARRLTGVSRPPMDCPAPAGPSPAGPALPEGRLAGSCRVTVNGEALPEGTVCALERHCGMRIRDGEYWYDRISGAWGMRGGPAGGCLGPGLNLGGPLRADASNGNTGVFVNGRELHVLDVLALRRIMPVVPPGRYWMDAQGNGGHEGEAQTGGAARGAAWDSTSRCAGGTTLDNTMLLIVTT